MAWASEAGAGSAVVMVRALLRRTAGLTRMNLFSGSWDSTVRIWDIWDPAGGIQLGEPLLQQSIWIGAVAFGRLANGRAVVVIAHGEKKGRFEVQMKRSYAQAPNMFLDRGFFPAASYLS